MNLVFKLLQIIILLILPFAILIRAATYVHVEYELGASMSLLLSISITTILMFVYFSFFYGTLTGKFGNFDAVKRRGLIAFLVVLIYSLHGILFFSSSNLKKPALQNEITEVHPIVRLSVSTLVYLDKDLIITDAQRVPEDYKKMGLRTAKSSLHYKQSSSNYAHALDLRTNGRSEFRNKCIEWYFKLLGFNTLRHIGTADHLHISLFSHDNPHAK